MARKALESQIQRSIIAWAGYLQHKYPSLKWLHAIPNGGSRRVVEAKIMKAEGVKSGVYDLFLPAARQGYYGFYLEIKAGKNKRSDTQIEFGTFAESEGYLQRVYWDARSAEDDIAWYLGMDTTL